MHIRLQRSGAGVDTSQSIVDVDSELMNITRPSSKCPSRKFLPMCGDYTADGYPCGQGVVPTCRKCADKGNVGMHGADKCPDQYRHTSTHTQTDV